MNGTTITLEHNIKDHKMLAPIVQGRLTLNSGNPLPTGYLTDQSTLYFSPFFGNYISLYHDSIWQTIEFTEKSLALGGLTASKPHDIWGYYNSGVLALDSTAWTDATTRATALTTQDGIYVKSGDATRLYLGTIYVDGSNYCQDNLTKRFVSNYYNRGRRRIYLKDNTGHTYGTSTWRYYNNDSSNKIEFITGIYDDLRLRLDIIGRMYNGGPAVNVGVDSESSGFDYTIIDCITSATTSQTYSAGGDRGISEGYHYFTLSERAYSGTANYVFMLLTGFIWN